MAARTHPSFAAMLGQAAGREDARMAAHLQACGRCAGDWATARRLVAAGRRALAAPRPSQRLLRRALKIYRAEREGAAERRGAPSALRLVLDSWSRLAPALRSRALQTPRFLRFEGAATVEIEIAPAARGVEIRGQVTPADFAPEVSLVAGKTRRRAAVQPDGTFVLRAVPRRKAELRIGDLSIRDLDP